MVFARSAAMAFNRYIDRNIDLANPRTAIIREIPKGIIKENSVLFFVIINCVLFIVTTIFINKLCFFLSPIALIIILGYSYTKRFTALCHIILGLGLGLAPIGAYIAVTGKFDVTPILFSLVVLFWVSGFDIIYSLQDEKFDRNYKLHSFPVFFGKEKARILSRIFHFLTFTLLAFLGVIEEFSAFYWIGTSIFCLLLIYQHTLIKIEHLQKIDPFFFTTNGIGSVIFAIFVILDILI